MPLSVVIGLPGIVVVNLSHIAYVNDWSGFRSTGTWRLGPNGDWNGCSRGFGSQACADVIAVAVDPEKAQPADLIQIDGFSAVETIKIGLYGVFVFT